MQGKLVHAETKQEDVKNEYKQLLRESSKVNAQEEENKMQRQSFQIDKFSLR